MTEAPKVQAGAQRPDDPRVRTIMLALDPSINTQVAVDALATLAADARRATDPEKMEAVAREHGIPALLDHLGLDGLGNEVNNLARRATEAEQRTFTCTRCGFLVDVAETFTHACPDEVQAIRSEREAAVRRADQLATALAWYAREESCPDCDGTRTVEENGTYVNCDWCGFTGSVSAEDAWDGGQRARAALAGDAQPAAKPMLTGSGYPARDPSRDVVSFWDDPNAQPAASFTPDIPHVKSTVKSDAQPAATEPTDEEQRILNFVVTRERSLVPDVCRWMGAFDTTRIFHVMRDMVDSGLLGWDDKGYFVPKPAGGERE